MGDKQTLNYSSDTNKHTAQPFPWVLEIPNVQHEQNHQQWAETVWLHQSDFEWPSVRNLHEHTTWISPYSPNSPLKLHRMETSCQEWITLGWKWNLMRGENSPKTAQIAARVHALAANQRIAQINLYQTSVLLFCIPQQFLIQFPKHCLSLGYFSKIKSW